MVFDCEFCNSIKSQMRFQVVPEDSVAACFSKERRAEAQLSLLRAQLSEQPGPTAPRSRERPRLIVPPPAA